MRPAGPRRRFGAALAGFAAAALIATSALAGAKVLHGTPHGDRLVGSAKSDRLIGNDGPDRLEGKGSADKLLGGKGADRLDGGAAYDVLLGGKGKDRIDARDGHRDRIDCGPGSDVVKVDRVEDGVRNCEKVVEP